MNSRFENDVLTLFPEGNIDTTNAEEFGKEVEEIRSQYPKGQLVLDLDNLKYISSAGLRQILKLKKKETVNLSEDLIREAKQVMEIIFSRTEELDTDLFNGYAMLPQTRFRWNKHSFAGFIRSYLGDLYEVECITSGSAAEPIKYLIRRYE